MQDVYSADLQDHLARAQDFGLICSPDVFDQLLHDHHDGAALGTVNRFVDWGAVTWEERELSGIALRHTQRADQTAEIG